MKKIHTIVTDLDGTLLGLDSEISELNQKVLQKAIDDEIKLILATGRRFYSTRPYALKFNGKVGVISNNGQVLKETPGDVRIKEHYIPTKIAKEIINLVQSQGLKAILHVDHFEEGIDLITEMPAENEIYGSYVSKRLERTKFVNDCLEEITDKTTVVAFIHEEREFLEELKLIINKTFQETRAIVTFIHKVGPCLEILKHGISKWSAIQDFLDINKNSSDGVIAFGDEANDLEMIQGAGIGVAMANATEIVKINANIISPYSFKEDGVGRLLLDMNIVKI